jgi:GrpB-like predicted nucleotidyltransferase (UPF0157 family)
MPRPVTIVDYDPQWPILYEEERRSVLEVAGEKILDIEHIGSTAVPDLCSKPIVDIMAGVGGEADADECVRLVATIGYDDVTPEPETQDWYYCLGKGFHSVGYHLHLVRHGSEFWERHILFRDYLRAHPEMAREYDVLKRGLALEYGSDRLGYTEAKTSFIESVVSRAAAVSHGT